MCINVFSLSHITLRIRRIQLRTPCIKGLRGRQRIIRFSHLLRRLAEIYTPLPPRRTHKDKDPDIAVYPLSELSL